MIRSTSPRVYLNPHVGEFTPSAHISVAIVALVPVVCRRLYTCMIVALSARYLKEMTLLVVQRHFPPVLYQRRVRVCKEVWASWIA